jgi:hypothetical protein
MLEVTLEDFVGNATQQEQFALKASLCEHLWI